MVNLPTAGQEVPAQDRNSGESRTPPRRDEEGPETRYHVTMTPVTGTILGRFGRDLGALAGFRNLRATAELGGNLTGLGDLRLNRGISRADLTGPSASCHWSSNVLPV